MTLCEVANILKTAHTLNYTQNPSELMMCLNQKIMETYLFLDTPLKKQLIALAEKNQLSLSTTAAIIIKHYYVAINGIYKNKYIKKGDKMIHIKIKNYTNNNITSIDATNCVYSYLAKPQNETYKALNWRNLNRQIQYDLENTIDNNRNKNIEIRIAYRIKKGNL